MNVDLDLICQLQNYQDRIRNVCVLAHVDHGKTTLSDHLIASNGLIHPRLAGELRYLDSKEEEQARGITMKSSSITLLYVPGGATRPQGPNSVSREEKLTSGVLFNLIDSPGHVDFCSEVSTAARLSDGAFVLVDAVEGVCIQTHAVLRQAWEEKVSLCLVLNKIDRLILELKMTPQEAYDRLSGIVSHVNMIVSSFRSEKFISEADSVLAHEDAKAVPGADKDKDKEGSPVAVEPNGSPDAHYELTLVDDEEDMFSPSKGNVAFASAHDGWAFRVEQFAEMYAAKMGCKAEALTRAMWGDYTMSTKTKRIVRIKSDQRGQVKPLFVALALDPLWKAYAACKAGNPGHHTELLTKMVQGLSLSDRVQDRTLQHSDARAALRAVLRAWLPLSEAVLGMAGEHLPSPVAAAAVRASRLLPPRHEALKGLEQTPELHAALNAMESAVAACDAAETAPTVVYVSKMVAVPAGILPRRPGEGISGDPTVERFLAFGRVFSGVVREGQAVHVLPATYNPADPRSSRQEATVTTLYLMMGRGLERLSLVPAGNVLAIGGLDNTILKSATVTSSSLCRPLAPLLFQSSPIVRVAVEPAHPGDMPALVEGLRLLHRADPLIVVSVQENGEHVLAAAGEVHLETCIKDLKERFAKVELLVSPPLVAFRETIMGPEEILEGAATTGGVQEPWHTVVEATTASGACTLRVRAVAMPAAMALLLDQHTDALRRAFAERRDKIADDQEEEYDLGGGSQAPVDPRALGERLKEASSSFASEAITSGPFASMVATSMIDTSPRIWMLGPKGFGPNLLSSSMSAFNGEGSGSLSMSLWDVPPSQIVQVGKQQQQVEQAHGGLEEGRETTSNVVSIPVELGNPPQASCRLGLASEGLESSENAAYAGLASRLEAILDDQGCSSDVGQRAEYLQHSVESGIATGFQLATSAGPLCDEPMWGVCFLVAARLNATHEADGLYDIRLLEDVYGPLSGQITSAARHIMRRAVMATSPRLVEALFLCEVTTSSEGLSAVYAVMGRRRARILREEMREGSDLFTIHAYLPAEASFGFADELRRRSSGAASASLMLSHWERLQVDPFFVPLTEEQREEFGEEGQGVGAPNLARRLIDSVRRRKGLTVEQKVVESATRQRTLARKV